MSVVYPVPQAPQQKAHDLAIAFVTKSPHTKTEKEMLAAYKQAYELFFKEFSSKKTED